MILTTGSGDSVSRISARRAWIPLKEGKTKLMMHEITVGCIDTTVPFRFGLTKVDQRNGVGTDSQACRAHMLSSFGVAGATDGLQAQASSSSQQEQCDSSIVRRIMGLETWIVEEEPGPKEAQRRGAAGAKEEALEGRRQFEATRPQMFEVGEVLDAPALEGLIPGSRCTARSRGPSLTRRPWRQGAEGSWYRSRSRRQSSCCRAISPGRGEAHQEQVAGRLHRRRSRRLLHGPPLKALRLVVSLAVVWRRD